MAQYKTAATSQGGYSTAEEELKKRKRQALLDASAAAPSTAGGPGGIVGPGGEAPRTDTGAYYDSRYDIPEDLAASRARAYENEILQSRMDIGQNYASKKRQLADTLAQMGFGSASGISAGEGANQAYNLALQQAGEINEAERKIRGQQSLEGLNWATGQRSYEQQQGLQREQLGSNMSIAQLQAQLQRDLQEGKITSEEAQNALDRAQRSQEFGGTMGLEYSKLAQDKGISEAQNQLQRDLQAGTITNEQYMQQRQILANQVQQEKELGFQYSQLGQQESQFGRTLAEQQAQFQSQQAQQASQFTQMYGSVDADGNWQPGSAYLSEAGLAKVQNQFQADLAKYQNGYYDAAGNYVPGVDYAQASRMAQDGAQIATAMEQFKFDLASQAKAAEAGYSFMQEWIATISKGTDKDKARDMVGYLRGLGVDVDALYPDLVKQGAGADTGGVGQAISGGADWFRRLFGGGR